ncbi:MAG: ABC transporter ATP-binding protein, partial [Rhizobiales bacterium]|nr:ABC transporter ATP-binding protein [Hyphomicrobiales bacterium]
QQRIALARAFVYEPSIILMDEPLGALDKKLRDHLQLEIKHLHEQLGITVLYVTHDQEEAMVMSDRICLMNNASIEQLGTPDDLYFRPQTEFAADFLGESNMIECVVKTSTSKQITATGPDGTVFKALPNPQLDRGKTCKIMVRPECMTLLGARSKADNMVTARLNETIITGAVTKTYAQLTNGQEITATQLTTGPLGKSSKGNTIKLGWPAERTVALAAGTGTNP